MKIILQHPYNSQLLQYKYDFILTRKQHKKAKIKQNIPWNLFIFVAFYATKMTQNLIKQPPQTIN